MMNLRMQEKIEKGEAIDVCWCERTPDGDYILTEFINDVDYCDSKAEAWIWSIGSHIETHRIYASTSNKFYQNPAFMCLFLR